MAVTAAVLVSLVVLLLEVVGVHFVGHVSAQDDGLVVFDEKTCGTVKKMVTNETKAEDLVNVTWVVGELRFGREHSFSYGDDDWHSVDEDVPVQASGIRCVEGNLTIWNTASMVDLSPLSNLTVIGGNLLIEYNAQLTTLTGLDGITTVGGGLNIQSNANLTTLTGLDGITTVGGDLEISYNAQLTTLTGLDGITKVEGDLKIYDNAQLTTLTGLDGITTVGADLIIRRNAQLTTLTGLDGITTVGGELQTQYNAQLTTLTGLDGITTVGGDLKIYDNNQLTTLTGLDGITTVGGDLRIWTNANLTTLTGLDGITTVGGDLKITDNDRLTTLTGVDGITTIGGNLWIGDNANLTTLTGLDGVTTVRGGLNIQSNANLTTLTGLDSITTVGGDLTIRGNTRLTTLTGLDGITTVGGDLEIRDNYQLTTLTGLDGITTVEGYLEIYGNDQLTTLTGLDGITTVGGYLRIRDNYQLTTLTGLDGITTVEGYLEIYGNYQLTTLTGLDGITTVGGDLVINWNANLTTLTGLTNLDSVRVGVSIRSNDNLVTLSGFGNHHTHVGTVINVLSNPNLSDSSVSDLPGHLLPQLETDILPKNTCGDDDAKIIPHNFIIDDDNDDLPADVENVRCIDGDLRIINLTNASSLVESLTNLTQLTAISGSLIINSTTLTNLDDLRNLQVKVIGGIQISHNDDLTNIAGLENLFHSHVNGDVLVHHNKELHDLSGLGNIATIRGDLEIKGNENLQSLTGLEHLTGVGGFVTVEGEKLTNLDALGTSLLGIGKSLSIKPGGIRSTINLTKLVGVGENIFLTFPHPSEKFLVNAQSKISFPSLIKDSGTAKASVVSSGSFVGMDIVLILLLSILSIFLAFLYAEYKLWIFDLAWPIDGVHSTTPLECMISAGNTVTDIMLGVYMFASALTTELNDTINWIEIDDAGTRTWLEDEVLERPDYVTDRDGSCTWPRTNLNPDGSPGKCVVYRLAVANAFFLIFSYAMTFIPWSVVLNRRRKQMHQWMKDTRRSKCPCGLLYYLNTSVLVFETVFLVPLEIELIDLLPWFKRIDGRDDIPPPSWMRIWGMGMSVLEDVAQAGITMTFLFHPQAGGKPTDKVTGFTSLILTIFHLLQNLVRWRDWGIKKSMHEQLHKANERADDEKLRADDAEARADRAENALRDAMPLMHMPRDRMLTRKSKSDIFMLDTVRGDA